MRRRQTESSIEWRKKKKEDQVLKLRNINTAQDGDEDTALNGKTNLNSNCTFEVAISREKACGICMDVIWDKEQDNERRFGILDSCNHIFCLSCIRNWRASKQYENGVVKACPECRVKSDYVTPSRFWFDNEETKKKIMDDYKAKLR